MYNFTIYPQYHICETFSDVISMFSDIKNEHTIALDTETSGLSPYINHTVGYSFAKAPNIGYYIPLRHLANPIKGQDLKDTWELLSNWLSFTPKVTKLFWNGKFDIKMMKRDGITLSGPIHDGMILLSLINKPLAFSKVKLKDAAKEILGLDNIGQKVLNNEKNGKGPLIDKFGYGIISYPVCGFYAAEDAVFTYKLCQYFLKKLEENE